MQIICTQKLSLELQKRMQFVRSMYFFNLPASEGTYTHQSDWSWNWPMKIASVSESIDMIGWIQVDGGWTYQFKTYAQRLRQ